MVEYDVIVVGAGPGGSATAALLARKGRKVLLLDKAKFPREKICGGAISGKSLSVLRELGLPPQVEAGPHAIVNGITFSSPKGDVVRLDFSKASKKHSSGYVSRRIIFDNIIFQHAKKTATATREGFNVTDLLRDGKKVVGVKGIDLETKKTEEFRAPLVIGADGANSIVAQKLGVFEIDPLHHCLALRAYYKGVKEMTDQIEIHFVDEVIPGYFWIFPLENGLANIGIGMLTKDVSEKRVDLKQLMQKAIELPLFRERFKDAVVVDYAKAWPLPLGSKRRKLSFDGALLIGDAASLIDPFSGEGMGNAMSSGRIAAGVADEALHANDFSEEFLRRHDERVWDEFGNELENSYRMQRLGKNKWLLNLVVGKAARSQAVREMIAGTFSNPEAMAKMSSPLFYLKVFLA